MLEQLIPLVTGGLGGLLGGNATGAMFRKSGMGVGSSSVVGMIAGAIATYFLGPTWGPMVGGLIGTGGLESILGNLLAGGAGGAGGTILMGIIRSMMGGR